MLIFTTFLFENRTGKTGYVHAAMCHEGTEGGTGIAGTRFSTSVLDGNEWLSPRPGCFFPGEERGDPFYRGLNGNQGRFGRAPEISAPP
jgi:hypothetical protein